MVTRRHRGLNMWKSCQTGHASACLQRHIPGLEVILESLCALLRRALVAFDLCPYILQTLPALVVDALVLLILTHESGHLWAVRKSRFVRTMWPRIAL